MARFSRYCHMLSRRRAEYFAARRFREVAVLPRQLKPSADEIVLSEGGDARPRDRILPSPRELPDLIRKLSHISPAAPAQSVTIHSQDNPLNRHACFSLGSRSSVAMPRWGIWGERSGKSDFSSFCVSFRRPIEWTLVWPSVGKEVSVRLGRPDF